MPACLRLHMTLTLNYMVIVACTLCCMSESECEQLLLPILPSYTGSAVPCYTVYVWAIKGIRWSKYSTLGRGNASRPLLVQSQRDHTVLRLRPLSVMNGARSA
jgi:hypothetical protein